MYKLIQKYQGYDKALLCKFVKVEVLKGADVVQVKSWAVINFSSFKIFQDDPTENEHRGLAQKNNNLLNPIFCHFDLIMWLEANIIEGSYT